MTEKINPFLRAMAGTHPIPQRCVTLPGKAGEAVRCSIYANRPGTCREFAAWMPDGGSNPLCTRVRASIGLAERPPIRPNASDGERRTG